MPEGQHPSLTHRKTERQRKQGGDQHLDRGVDQRW